MQQLSTRSQALQEPVYATFRQRAAPPKQAHVQALEGMWEEALPDCEEVNYLGDTLAPLLAYEALAADTKQYHPRDVWLGRHDQGKHEERPPPPPAPTLIPSHRFVTAPNHRDCWDSSLSHPGEMLGDRFFETVERGLTCDT